MSAGGHRALRHVPRGDLRCRRTLSCLQMSEDARGGGPGPIARVRVQADGLMIRILGLETGTRLGCWPGRLWNLTLSSPQVSTCPPPMARAPGSPTLGAGDTSIWGLCQLKICPPQGLGQHPFHASRPPTHTCC